MIRVIPTATSEGQTELQAGWNLVCLRVAPSNSAIAQVLSSIAGHYELVNGYDTASGTWLTYNPNVPGAATLHEIHEDTAFWILMTQADTLTVSGTQPGGVTQQLSTGWNLVAYPAMESRTVAKALESISGHYTLVYGYTGDPANPWRRYSVAAPSWANTLSHLEPGRGYWVYVSEARTLHIGTGLQRFGVAANGGIADFDYAHVGVGWFHNWGPGNNVPPEGGLTFCGTVGAWGGTVAAGSASIEWWLSTYPERYPDGMVWFIGNEIGWDDGGFTATQYAQHYHEWHTYIKGLNATFQIGPGALLPIFQAYHGYTLTGIEWMTEVRIQYQHLYGTPMPVDVYNMHVYYLYPTFRDEEVYDTIQWLRQAMADTWDARDKPLYITEIGNLYSASTTQVQGRMQATFDYLTAATSEQYGCTTDNNLLVQKWAWFSLSGWSPDEGNHRWDYTALFDYDTKEIKPLGETYATFTSTYANATQ